MDFLQSLPAPLLALGPRGLRWWQWAALLVLLVGSWILGLVLGRLSRVVLASVARRTSIRWDDVVVPKLQGPLTFGWTATVATLVLPVARLPQSAERAWDRGFFTVLFFAFFWLLWRIVAITRELMERSVWATANPASRSLLPLGGRVAQVLVLAIGLVAILAQLGYPVASLVAGLGIGGLALALAAQKTVENLFGAFALSLDQAFRPGDAIKVDGTVEGTVEVVGLRSTRLRTADRSLVTIPNGKLADMRIESFTARDRLRFGGVFNLVLGTTAAQIAEVLAGWEAVLRGHAKVWPDGVLVRLKDIGTFALHVEVNAWFATTSWEEFTTIRQDVLLRFMAAVEAAGTSFAFPTQTLHVEAQGVARDVAQPKAREQGAAGLEPGA